MKPIEIEILLHYYSNPDNYGDLGNEAVKFDVSNAVLQLINIDQLLEHEPLYGENGITKKYRLTDRGYACVMGLCEMPLPVAQWYIPGQIDTMSRLLKPLGNPEEFDRRAFIGEGALTPVAGEAVLGQCLCIGPQTVDGKIQPHCPCVMKGNELTAAVASTRRELKKP